MLSIVLITVDISGDINLLNKLAGIFSVIHFTVQMQITEFPNSLNPDEAAHNELPHLDLYC